MLRARDIMSKNVISVQKDIPILEAVKLLVENNIFKQVNTWMIEYLAGEIAYERGDYPEAVTRFVNAISLQPNSPGTYYAYLHESLARTYEQMGETDRAREEYEKITQLTLGRVGGGDIYARSFYMLGKIHEQQGKKSKAKKNYQKFLDLWKDADPGLAEVEDARKRLAGLK